MSLECVTGRSAHDPALSGSSRRQGSSLPSQRRDVDLRGNSVKHKAGDELGSWRLVKPLGEGGNGQVWEVEPAESSASRAMKILDSRKADSERYARFREEVSTLRELDGSDLAVLPILDSSLPEDIRNTPAWYVMPLAEPLGEALAGKPVPECVRAFAGLAGTLGQLASLRLNHRDVKPANLYIRDGRSEVGDFGLIKRPRPTDHVITDEGRRPGPYAFMPSEAFLRPDEADDELIDVYCLAMSLWTIVAGEVIPPRHSIEPGGHYGLGKRRQEQNHIDELDEILSAATAADPDERPRMEQLAQRLEAWLGGLETGTGYGGELAALERNKRQILRWTVLYAQTPECFFGMNILSEEHREEASLPKDLTWSQISAAFDALHEEGLLDGKPGDHRCEDGTVQWWMNVYPSAHGVEQVIDTTVLITRLAPLLRSLPRNVGVGMNLSREDQAPDGFDDWKLPPPEYVLLMRQAEAYGLASFTEHAASGSISLGNVRLLNRGLELLAALEQQSDQLRINGGGAASEQPASSPAGGSGVSSEQSLPVGEPGQETELKPEPEAKPEERPQPVFQPELLRGRILPWIYAQALDSQEPGFVCRVALAANTPTNPEPTLRSSDWDAFEREVNLTSFEVALHDWVTPVPLRPAEMYWELTEPTKNYCMTASRPARKMFVQGFTIGGRASLSLRPAQTVGPPGWMIFALDTVICPDSDTLTEDEGRPLSPHDLANLVYVMLTSLLDELAPKLLPLVGASHPTAVSCLALPNGDKFSRYLDLSRFAARRVNGATGPYAIDWSPASHEEVSTPNARFDAIRQQIELLFTSGGFRGYDQTLNTLEAPRVQPRQIS